MDLFSLPGTTITDGKTFLKQQRQKVPRYRCFSLSDFKEFDRCSFSFFVKHHLGKKYQFEEGSANKAVGSLLDLTIKKLHQAKAYNQPLEFLENIIKAAEREMREKTEKEGEQSYFGPQMEYLTEEVLEKTRLIFRSYYNALKGKFNPILSSKTFWEYDLIATDGETLRLWGGPDALEMGEDGVPEIVDYKYFEDNEKGKDHLDMENMPKLYTLLAAFELKRMGYNHARFKIRMWQDPTDNSMYEEFDLSTIDNFSDFFKQKAEVILRAEELDFCEKQYCKVCHSEQRPQWVTEYYSRVWQGR